MTQEKLLPVRELCLQSVYLSLFLPLSSFFRIMPLTFYSTIFLYRVHDDKLKMSDRLTIEQRHNNMAAIRGRDTKPEIL